VEATEALKITAPDLMNLGLVDEIVEEPIGGAHRDFAEAAALVDAALSKHLKELQVMDSSSRLDARYKKFRAMGRAGQAFTEPAAAGGSTPSS
jgi:acetyl-CoA carboxylase carboxyl transferase subunit alpha